jgi:hypothetical protein
MYIQAFADDILLYIIIDNTDTSASLNDDLNKLTHGQNSGLYLLIPLKQND